MTTMKTALEFEFPKHTQHPLFRLCIQCAVAMEEGFPEDVQKMLANKLREKSLEHLGSHRFEEETK